MPIATPEQYAEMLDAAKSGGYAYPAVNVTSSSTLNAALRGFAEAGSDGIVQVSTGGGEFASGAAKEMALGAQALAEFARVVGPRCPVRIALHTDHCQADKLDAYVRPLLALSKHRVARGDTPLFNSHMFDGSALPLPENLAIAKELLAECAPLGVVLEVEAGVVGGEEDGVDAAGSPQDRLYTTPDDMLAVADALGTGERGRYLLAATFGNVHGVYAPGNVRLRPKVLRDGQQALAAAHPGRSFELVFHGGSGSDPTDIAEAVSYGVVKMNIDTDTQYAYTRAIAGHVLGNYDGVLKVDGGTGNKKAYDPRVWGRAAEESMAARVSEACHQLGSAGRSLG